MEGHSLHSNGLANGTGALNTNTSSSSIATNGYLSGRHEAIRNGPTAQSGPDMVLPADDIMTWSAEQPVKLRMSDSGPLAMKPVSIVTAFRQTVDKFSSHLALAYKVDGRWTKISFSEYYELVLKAAKAFIQLGLEMHYGVGIIGFNSPEWFISNLGAIFAGGLSIGFYTTNSPETCHYIAQDSRCNIIVVENDHQLQKILSIRQRLPHLKAIVQYKGQPKSSDGGIYSWQEFLDLSRLVSDEQLNSRIKSLAPNKCCTLVYTSGTTGEPKAVMLNHDNFVWTATVAGTKFHYGCAVEEMVSYLPLSHVAAQITDIFIPLVFGGSIYFAEPDALKGSLFETVRQVKPTIFLGVPRVWEKMQEQMVSISKSQWMFTKKIAQVAKWIGYWGNMSRMNGGDVPYGWAVANLLVFRKVRSALGFDRCRMCVTSAAPIMKHTLDFFMSIDIPLMEIYGMSETTGPITLSLPWKYRTVSAGISLGGCETKIVPLDEMKEGEGEIYISGRNVFMGYLNQEEKTREVFDKEGFLKSGDTGRIDSDGFLFITGRIKELLITAGGENISPTLIEGHVKEQLPCISNCMLVGDQKKFLSMLITIKTEVDPQLLEPTDKLLPVSAEWCRSLGCNFSTLSELIEKSDDRVIGAIQKAIDLANEKAPSRAQIIQKWSILPKDFSTSGGEFGPTFKLKRSVVAKIYQETIESFYTEAMD